MQSPTTTARRLSRTSIQALVASIFAALVLGLFGTAPARADTAQDGDTWPTFVPGITAARCAADGSEKVTLHIQKAIDGRVVETDRFRYELEDGQNLLLGDDSNSEYVLVGSDGQPVAIPIPSDNRLDYLVWWKDPSGVDQKVGIFWFTRFGTCVEDPGSDPDPVPVPAPKPAKPTVQILGGAQYKTSGVARTCRINNTADATKKSNIYAWWVTTTNGRTVAKGSRTIADGGRSDVQLKLGVGTYTCWAQSIDGKTAKSFTVKYAPPSFTVVNKAKGLVRVCHYSSSYKTGWQDWSGGKWKKSKHWSKTKAQGSCTTRNTPNVGYGKSNKVLMTLAKPGDDVKRVVKITNRSAAS